MQNGYRFISYNGFKQNYGKTGALRKLNLRSCILLWDVSITKRSDRRKVGSFQSFDFVSEDSWIYNQLENIKTSLDWDWFAYEVEMGTKFISERIDLCKLLDLILLFFHILFVKNEIIFLLKEIAQYLKFQHLNI